MNKRKRYKNYLVESEQHNQSIIAKYGMPTETKPPLTRDILPKSSDMQYRQIYARTLFIKKNGSLSF